MSNNAAKLLAQTALEPPYTEALLYIVNPRQFDENAAEEISTSILSELEVLPLAPIPTDLDRARVAVVEFKDLHTTSSHVDAVSPAVRIVAQASELPNLKLKGTALSVEKLVPALKKLLADKNWSSAQVSSLLSNVILQTAEKDVNREKEEKSRTKKEREREQDRERERERGRERERKPKNENEMAVPKLPASLQPLLKKFDEQDVEGWLEQARTIYGKFEIKEDNVPLYLGAHLPAYAEGVHEEFMGKGWARYTAEMVKHMQGDRTPSAVRQKLLRFQQGNESVRAFVQRVAAAARKAGPPLAEVEVCRVLLQVLPPEYSRLMVGAGCATVSDFLTRLENVLVESEIVGKDDGADRISKLERLVQQKLQASTENKILALLDTASAPPASLEAKLLEKLEQLGLGQPAAAPQPPKPEPAREDKLDQLWAMFVGGASNAGRGGRGANRGGGAGGQRVERAQRQQPWEPAGPPQAPPQAQYVQNVPYYSNMPPPYPAPNQQPPPAESFPMPVTGPQYFLPMQHPGPQQYQQHGAYPGYAQQGNAMFHRGGQGPQRREIRACNFCKIVGHLYADCRKRKAFLEQQQGPRN